VVYDLCADDQCRRGDIRTDRVKSVHAGVDHLVDNEREFKGYSDASVFAIAAYNIGPVTVKRAMRATGLKDPTWNQTWHAMTPRMVTDFSTYSEKEDKRDQVIDYVYRVTHYRFVYNLHQRELELEEVRALLADAPPVPKAKRKQSRKKKAANAN